ncbi:MAG TPA: class I SAM-dependent methyltransferase [Bacteroidetes bacterium]|nr:class I SAM-dependent methyltransferase [Bacteroidota bacterium]
MGIKHYFSSNEAKRALFIFDLIAPFYHLIDKGTHQTYQKMAGQLNTRIPLKGKSILDVGCGTGSWLAALSRFDLKKGVGVDFSKKMLAEAKKNHPALEFIQQNGENLSAFADDSFDVVTATFVLHGMQAGKRALLLEEMKRVAKKFVVIHDFHKGSSFAVWLLETLERSDYVRFKKHFKEEMESVFPAVEILPGDNGNALYIGIL